MGWACPPRWQGFPHTDHNAETGEPLNPRAEREARERIARDPRIREVWDEPPQNGMWAALVDGYNAEGCSSIHAWSWVDLEKEMWAICKGDPY